MHLILGLAVALAAFTLVGASAWLTAGATGKGQHKAPRGDRYDDYGPGVTPVDVAGQVLFFAPPASRDRFADWTVWLPRTPGLDEPDPERALELAPLPSPPRRGCIDCGHPLPASEAVRCSYQGLIAYRCDQGTSCSHWAAAFEDVQGEPFDDAQVAEVANPVGNSVTSEVASGNGHDHDALVARFERLFPLWEPMHGHPDTESAVESIAHRVLTPDVLASLDAARSAVTHG